MHSIADGWRLQVWTRLRTNENLFQLNYQVAVSAAFVWWAKRTLKPGIALPWRRSRWRSSGGGCWTEVAIAWHGRSMPSADGAASAGSRITRSATGLIGCAAEAGASRCGSEAMSH